MRTNTMNSATIFMHNRSNENYWQRKELWTHYIYIYALNRYMCAKKIQIRVFILLVYTDYIVTKSWYIVKKKCRNPGEDGERHKANQGKSLRCFNGDLGKFDCMKLWFLLLSFTAQEVCNGRPGRHFYLVLVTFPLLFGNRFFFFQGAGVRMKMHEHVGTCMNIFMNMYE